MSAWIWISVVLLAGMLVWFWQTRAKIYDQIFSTEHFQEVVAQLRKLKDAGLKAFDQEKANEAEPPLFDVTPEDPRTATTNAGLLLLYTVDEIPEDNVCLHTLSLSIAGRYTPHAVGEQFAFFVATQLFGDVGQIWFEVSESNVFYTRCITELPEEMERFRNRVVIVPDDDEIVELRQHYYEVRHEIPFHRMDTGLRHYQGGLSE